MTDLSNDRKRARRETPGIGEALDGAGNRPDRWEKFGTTLNQFSTGPDGILIRGGQFRMMADGKGAVIEPGGKLNIKLKRFTDFEVETEDGAFRMHNEASQPSSSAYPRPMMIRNVSASLQKVARNIKAIRQLKEVLQIFT